MASIMREEFCAYDEATETSNMNTPAAAYLLQLINDGAGCQFRTGRKVCGKRTKVDG